MVSVRTGTLLLLGAIGLAFVTSRAVIGTQPSPTFGTVCYTSAKALAAEASKFAGEPVGGPFVFRDEVCLLWRNPRR